MNVEIKKGEKLCITSYSEEMMTNFLLTLRGETFITKGGIEINGPIVYLDGNRSTFFSGKTLRDNIIVHRLMNKNKYKDILKIVNLDVNEFQGRDMIQVIRGGKNFSYSERIKILLARMMYSEEGEIYMINNIFDKMGLEN